MRQPMSRIHIISVRGIEYADAILDLDTRPKNLLVVRSFEIAKVVRWEFEVGEFEVGEFEMAGEG